MTKQSSAMSAPIAARRPSLSNCHGITREDDYSWMRADNWQDVMRDPSVLPEEIRTHLDAENSYTNEAMADTAALQETLFAELKGRIKQDDSSVPARDGPFEYYIRYVTDGQHPLFCRRPYGGDEEHVLVDGNSLARDHAYFDIAYVSQSPDHTLIAYAVDTTGSEFYTINIIDAASGALIDTSITDSSGRFQWAADSKTLLYIWRDENHRPRKVFAHRLEAAEENRLIYELTDPGRFLEIGRTQDRKFLTLGVHDHETAEIQLIDAANPLSTPLLVAPREDKHDYSVDHHEDRLIILTNSDGAADFRIVEAPLDDPSRRNWREIEPHRPGRLILHVVAFKDFLVRLEREDGLPRIVIRRFSDGEEHAIAFDEEAYALGVQPLYGFDTRVLRFSYSSMTTPTQVFDYDMETRERSLRKTQEIPSGHDPSHYVTRRVMAPAKDGESVPVSLLYHRDTPLDGTAPLLLYGYGAYGIALPAEFSTEALSLVDRGFVYAIAHVRGGKEKGYAWYTEGKREKKINSFTDFIAAGEFLTSENFTSRGHIVAHGGSAGGMLVSAAANMAPDLFLGIVADVPFVDVLATMLDATLPLTPPEWQEWGNPIESEKDFRTIAAYSPYDNVHTCTYPHILALAGLADSRVTYWEPAKWIAKLREHNESENYVLLKTNMEAGHAGASGRFERLKEVALAYAFALKLTDRTSI